MPDDGSTAGQLDHGLWWEPTVIVAIDIAGFRRHGSDDSKLLDDGKSPVISDMENVIRSFKESKPWTERAVRIGVIADTDFMLLAHHPLAKHTHTYLEDKSATDSPRVVPWL